MTFNPELLRFIKYMDFKIKCASYQVKNPVRLDYDKVERHLKELEDLKGPKIEELKSVMPKVVVTKKKTKPKVTHKKDGTLSAHGEKWFALLREHKLPPTFNGEVEIIEGYKEANPGSPVQVKAWLDSLGWKPTTFDYKKDKDTGEERKIPQVRKEGELCQSVLKLKDKEPSIEVLEGLTVIQHRIGVFQGFLSEALEREGKYYVRAEIGGLTNTLRFKHKKPMVNLPGVDKPWGEEIRGCIIAEEGETFCGSDMSSLESTTKRHYIYPHDPEYADEMSKEGFDEHLDLALKNGQITQEEYDQYTGGNKTDAITLIRKDYKPINYMAVYGAMPKKVSRETGMSVSKSKGLLDAYWERNWAVKVVAKEQYTKEVGGYKWLKNPVSGFYYELRYDKDRFSTLNQGTGVYIFDSWLARCAKLGYWGQMQFHDETGSSVTDPSQTREVLKQGVENLNRDLTLNVDFGIETKFGPSYAATH